MKLTLCWDGSYTLYAASIVSFSAGLKLLTGVDWLSWWLVTVWWWAPALVLGSLMMIAVGREALQEIDNDQG